jgi:hypothetical protein
VGWLIMPRIDSAPLEQSAFPQTQVPFDYFTQQATPGAFGAQVGEAAQRLGTSMEQASDMLMKHQLAFWQLRNETLAKEADVIAAKRLVDLQFNPQNGFMYKYGKDAMDNLPAAMGAIQEVRKSALNMLPNEHSRNMFDQVFLRRMQYTQESVASHAGTENKKWQVNTSEARIDNEMNMLTTAAYDDDKFNVSVATIRAETLSKAELLGMSPEQTQKMLDHNTSEAWQHRLNAVTVHNPDLAREMFSLNADQVDAAHRPVIDNHIMMHQEASMRAAIMRQNHADARAEKELKRTQGLNEADWLEKAYTTQNLDIHAVAEDVRTNKISVEGMKAIHAAMTSADKIEDNNLKMHIWAHYADGHDIRPEAIEAGDKGLLNAPSVIAMLRASADKPDEVQAEQYRVLKSAVGGHDAENGFFKDPQLQKEAELRWSSAQSEFYRRVHPSKGRPGEDPRLVVQDMIPRYVKVEPTPAAWPNPRLGTIHGTDDVKDVAIRTLQAHENGRMSDQQYAVEVELLNKYRIYWAEQDRKRQVLKDQTKPPTGYEKK